ncbi:hypothetical protein BZK31_17905 [Pseudomonas floridensis]|uniref:AAA+ ATPase domain-containing protein n=2 Tax=Pseudomonas TaxID=286 RepID=A0A1X0N3G5_9PSED|nr:hypothetical protein BZK31_17905 [Pseudomonas floridensis]
MVLEGLHGFQYHWPERTQVIKALDDVVNAKSSMIVMLRGASGAGISSILDEFSSKHPSGVIVVTPRLYDDKINIVGQVLHALFPLSDFPSHKRTPQSLLHLREADRKIIVFDDLDIITSQNGMQEVVFDQLKELTRYPGNFTTILSTRNKKLILDYSELNRVTKIVVHVSGNIPAADIGAVIRKFYDWCNNQYDTDLLVPCDLRLGKRARDITIDQLINVCESLYCTDLLEILSRSNGRARNFATAPSLPEALYHLPELRHAAESKAFG